MNEALFSTSEPLPRAETAPSRSAPAGHGCLLLLVVLFGFQPVGTAAAQEPATLYAGLIKNKGYVVGSPLAASGLMRFEGDTLWTHIGWNHPRIFGIDYDPADPNVRYLAAGNGVLRTRDGGDSWRIVTGWEITEPQDIAVDPNAPEHLYLATPYGVWRSEDGGDRWTEASEGIPVAHTYTQDVHVDRMQAGRVVAATHGGLYLSEDGARTWRLVAAEGIPVYSLDQGTTDPDVWIAGTGGQGVLLSRDGGGSWEPARGGFRDTTIYGVAIDPFDAQRMAAGGWDTGVYVSADGGRSWMQRQGGLPVPHVYEVLFDAVEPGRLWTATVEQGIFHSDDLGQHWAYAGMYGTLVFDMTFIPDQPK